MINFNYTPKWKKVKPKKYKEQGNQVYYYLFFIVTGIIFFIFHTMSDETVPRPAPPKAPPEIVERADEEENAVVTVNEDSLLADERNAYGGQPLIVDEGTYVVIEKKAHRLMVLRDGEKVKEYGVAVGKNKGDKKRVGDMKTPEGTFAVQQIQNASSWTHDFRDGKGETPNAYGPIFIRLKTSQWTGIGIHGTHDPASIGTDVTEGCIRLENDDLLEFKEMIAVGTKVFINP